MTDATEPQVTDLLGAQPIAKAVEIGTQRGLDAIAALWTTLLKPAAEEVGLLFQDRVRAYRQHNVSAVTDKAVAMFAASQSGRVRPAPAPGDFIFGAGFDVP